MPPFSCDLNNETNTSMMSGESNPTKDQRNNNDDETVLMSSCSAFQCLENSFCLDMESLSSLLDWLGIKDDQESYEYETQVDNRLNKNLDCINFTGCPTGLRAPSFSLPQQVNHDLLDNEYASSHELLIDCLLEEARNRKIHDSPSDKRPSKSKLSKISPSSVCVDPSSAMICPNSLNFMSDPSTSKQEQSIIRKRRKKVKVPKILDRKRQYTQYFRDSPYRKMEDEPISLDESLQDSSSGSYWGKNFIIETIHSNAILQKDKGYGIPLGENISAKGRNDTLQKLREKMRIMIEVEDNRPSAVIKRVDAAEFRIDHDTIETRSIIGIKMGFVRVKYGILLQWKLDGMVHFICLRKMCFDSFMKGPAKQQILFPRCISNPPQNLSPEEDSRSSKDSFSSDLGAISPSFSFGSFDLEDLRLSSDKKSQTDSQKSLTEVSVPILQPPYLVPRPISFPPATLEVTVLRARGLQVKRGKNKERQIDSLVRVSIGKQTHQTNIVRRTNNPVFGTGDNHFILNCTTGSVLVQILDFKKPKNPRLIAFCNFPLSLVEARPANGHIPAKEVTLPCKMFCVPEGPNGGCPFGSVTLSVIRRDAYTCWAQEELRERVKLSRSKQMHKTN